MCAVRSVLSFTGKTRNLGGHWTIARPTASRITSASTYSNDPSSECATSIIRTWDHAHELHERWRDKLDDILCLARQVQPPTNCDYHKTTYFKASGTYCAQYANTRSSTYCRGPRDSNAGVVTKTSPMFIWHGRGTWKKWVRTFFFF